MRSPRPRRSPGQALVQLGFSAAMVEEAVRAPRARVRIEVPLDGFKQALRSCR